MGLFGSKENKSKVNLTKEERVSRVNLRKQEVQNVCAGFGAIGGGIMNTAKARVALVLDYSGSMNSLYSDGTVQEIIEQMLPMALNFDDDGTMETWLFDDGFHRLPEINMGNFYDYVNTEVIGKYRMGATAYAPVMKDIRKYYREETPTNLPTYVIFITDGDNADHNNATNAIREFSKDPIFWQFVGVGNARFAYLEKLDTMDGRYIDNANFFKVGKAADITYNDLLAEFPAWLADSKVQGML